MIDEPAVKFNLNDPMSWQPGNLPQGWRWEKIDKLDRRLTAEAMGAEYHLFSPIGVDWSLSYARLWLMRHECEM